MNENKQGLNSSQKRKLRENLIGYSFILPNLIGYSVFVFAPVIFSFVLSVMKWDGSQAPMEFVGLANFTEIFGDELFTGAFMHTVAYALMTVLPTLVLSLLLAVLLNSKIKGIPFYRAAFFFPYIASTVAVGAVWNMLFQPDFGPINEFLKFIGIADPPRWVVDTDWAMVAVAIVTIWKYMGYYMIVYLAALQGISGELYEASSIDGANSFQRFFKITLPMLTPTIFFNVVMAVISSFQYFTQAFVMTEGGPLNSTLFYNLYLYTKAYKELKMGYAAALAWIMFIIILFFTLLVIKSSSFWVYYQNDDQI